MICMGEFQPKEKPVSVLTSPSPGGSMHPSSQPLQAGVQARAQIHRAAETCSVITTLAVAGAFAGPGCKYWAGGTLTSMNL